VSNVSDFSSLVYSNYSISEQEDPTGDTPTGISEEGAYYWRVLASDLIDNSSWSETRVFYYDLNAPDLTFINQTGEDGLIINNSHPLDQGENMSIYINVSDVDIDSVWIVVWDAIKGGTEKFRSLLTYVGGVLWMAVIPTDYTWDLLSYNYTIYANDSLNQTSEYDGNFTLLKGDATISVSPDPVNTTTNVTVSGYLNLTNGSVLGNYPINFYVNGTLLLFSNVTPIGTYDNYQEFNDTTSSEFDRGDYYQTTSDGDNLTLSEGNAYGNYTRILDAGARVEWNYIHFSWTGESCSGTVGFQDGDSNDYSETEDTYIHSDFGTSNYGSESSIIIDGSPDSLRGLIRFGDILGKRFNQVPENSTILGANITLEVYDTGNQVTVYEVLENWTESEATYNNRLSGTQWGSGGCSAPPSRSASSEDSFTAGSEGSYTFDIINAMKRWVNGTSYNYGVVLDMPTSNGISINSSEYSNQQVRPKLSVQFSSNECTDVKFYIRTSNDKNSWTDWREVNSGEAINDSNIASRYLQYRVELSSVNNSITPILEEIFINYTAIVTNSSGDYEYNFTNPIGYGVYPISVNTSVRTIDISAMTNLSVETGVAPTLELVTPTDGQWFNYSNLNLTYNATDVNDDMVLSELIINNQVNATNSTAINNGIYSNFSINFSSGEYNWTVNVTDSTGMVATDTSRKFYIDLIDPNITLIFPYDDSDHSVSQINLSFNATDNMDSVLDCDVVLDGNVINSTTSNNGVIKNVSSGLLLDGMHYWNVTCTDESGRSYTSETWSFNITDTPPNVTLFSPSLNYVDDDGTISFQYNATDNSGFLNCSLILNGSFDKTNQSKILNGQYNIVDKIGIPEGWHNWTIECFDLSENSHKPLARNFSVDLNPPDVDLNLPSDSSVFSAGDVNFNFTATDVIDSLLSCNLTINNVIEDSIAATSGDLENSFVTGLTDGLKYWNVTCIDDVGHSNTSVTWTVNISEAPSVVLNTGNESAYTESQINLTYTPSDNTNLSSCNLYLDGVFNQSNSTVIFNGQQNNFTVYGLEDGSYYWYVNCSDYIGLWNYSETRVFYIDSNAPDIALHYPDGHDVYSQNITFNFTVLDAVDDNLTCNLTVDTTVEISNFGAINGSVTNKTLSGVTDGFHTWHVNCTDDAGNSNGSLVYNFTRFTNPAVNLFYPDDNHWFNVSGFNLTYVPEDDEGITISYLIINGKVNRTNSTAITNGFFNNFTIEYFHDGKYNWTVNVTDVSGLNGTDSERIFYVDTQSPRLVLNAPNGTETLVTNNVTFNFTSTDNLDLNIDCNLTVDEEVEYSDVSANGSDVLNNVILSDGNHTWNVMCWDNASNFNYSETINFTVKAPPNVTLDDPTPNERHNTKNITFVYTPLDPIGINNCSLYIDGAYNQTEPSPVKNQQNNLSVYGISEGQHNWTVGCYDSDDNYFEPTAINFIVDLSGPDIYLESPENDSGIYYTGGNVIFEWRADDEFSGDLRCNLTVDGNVEEEAKPVSDNISTSEPVSLGMGGHYWNVTCWDADFTGNVNTGITWFFNLTYPDFKVNITSLVFNTSEPKEEETVEINATVYNTGGADVENVIVKFYDGDPDLSGQQINGDRAVNLSRYGMNVTGVYWSSDLGTSEIFVVVDPPVASNGSYDEWNESNNKISRNLSVGSWEFFYGDILSVSDYSLETDLNLSLIRWSIDSIENGNIFVSDYKSIISWSDLIAIGKNKTGSNSSINDFSDIDSLLNTTEFNDSVYNVFTNNGNPKATTKYLVFDNFVYEVPVADSINNSNFKTGILWDSSDDVGDGEFSQDDKEDLVFSTQLNESTQGAYGIYDYEMRVPAKLREYDETDSNSVIFYLEIY
ncbi:DNRLRE domain-containing protein, partial [Candidatus Pacearchaeota archaeon]|nr:DNRLRE domain-containing protein [Candidatus Pacearchaeota archaeon]